MDCTPWPTNGLRRASVNSFGFGGTNSHAVLDDAYNFLRLRNLTGNHSTVTSPPTREELRTGQKFTITAPLTPPDSPNFEFQGIEYTPKLLVLSASDEKGIGRLSKSYSKHFARNSIPVQDETKYMNNLAYTLEARRSSLPWKSFAVAKSFNHLREFEVITSKPMQSNSNPRLGFIFTGQGAQWYAMGRELLAYPAFRNSLLRAEEYLLQLGCQWLLLEELLKDKDNSRCQDPELSQPLCTAVQVAMVDLLKVFNVSPNAVIGHSSGEIAAA